MQDTPAIIQALGGNAAVATALGVETKVISHWVRRGIPARFWPDVVALAAERGQHDITLDRLRRPMWQAKARA